MCFISLPCIVYSNKSMGCWFFIFVNKDSTGTCDYAGFSHEKTIIKAVREDGPLFQCSPFLLQ